MLLKSKRYENFSENLTLNFDEENFQCYSRLENVNENSHPIMLSRNPELTKLRCHKKIYHNGVKQTFSELQAEF